MLAKAQFTQLPDSLINSCHMQPINRSMWREHLEPRSVKDARLTASFMLLIPAVVLPLAGIASLCTGSLVTGPTNVNSSPVLEFSVSFGLPFVFVFGAWAMLKFSDRAVRVAAFPYGVGGALMIFVVNYLTSDATVSGQMYYALPVVFGGYLLRRIGAGILTFVAGSLSVLNAVLLAEPDTVLSDVTTLTITFAALSLVVARSRDREQNAHAALYQAARVDNLTDLSTRAVVEEELNLAFGRLGKHIGPGLIVIDVDRFKSINDTHGHPVGDACLVHIANVLREQVGPTETVSRMGGDELAVAIPQCVADTVQYRATQIASAVRQAPLQLDDGSQIELTVSVGFAHAPRDADNLNDLYQQADSALYQAKANGRDGVGLPVALRDPEAGVVAADQVTRPGGRRQGTIPEQVAPAEQSATEPEPGAQSEKF